MASTGSIAAAMQLLQAGAWQEAEGAARCALIDHPEDDYATFLFGLAVAAMGEASRAAPTLNQLADRRPDAPHPCVDLGALQPALPRSLVARQYHACLRIAPADARLRLAFAEFLLDNDLPDEADRILADATVSPATLHLRGLAQAECARFAEAIVSFESAVAADPSAAASWSNLGMMRKIVGEFPAAIAAHDRAVALAPGNPRFRVNRAVALLKSGQWEPAWLDYEARLDLPESAPIDRARILPSLQPDQSLVGLTVLALHEDGFGDTLQFLRYLPLLADRGAAVLVCVPPTLRRVLEGVPGVAAVFTDARNLPPHDYLCPVFSLPRVFGTTVQTVPSVPVVRLEEGLVRRWARRLPNAGLRIGLVWAGQARPALPGFRTLDRRRSAGLAVFERLSAFSGVSLVSLQAGPPARQAVLSGMPLIDLMPEVTDFADTAAIIASLDVVVSVDTSVVHLAGLMHKPVFLLDRYDGCWRWLDGRTDSPWYPHLTIFRQPAPGDWASAVAQATESLRAMAMFREAGQLAPANLRDAAFVA